MKNKIIFGVTKCKYCKKTIKGIVAYFEIFREQNSEYEKVYHFCSKNCRKEELNDPKYVKRYAAKEINKMPGKEQWKDLIGFEGIYQISSHGRVKALERPVMNKNNSTAIRSEKIMKNQMSRNGAYYIILNNAGKVKTLFIQKLINTHFN